MENLHNYPKEELQRCPFHSQQQNNENYMNSEDNTEKPCKPDETGTDPKRYEPNKFEKGSNEKSGGDGSTESAAKKLNN
ncbi:hypothetical protein B0A79_15675 [Flavobacterium piscis]|uniref:Uncharacterized protein n=1 Tax=Flavobacterium piscis TaxID=1114874 RepID=A0ABX2XUJ1_9FLAO|nr:hypothetical protein [Flavobacterium piscis]OCB78246.1 hypothetical protein FLP_00630 [Flavobacterium piscis]OXG02388.1 hypothetical protein B0A79_15675 [Flavobacterium piscis]